MVVSLFLISPMVLSDEDGTHLNFEEFKASRLEGLDKHIKALQDSKTCIEKSKNHDELKACRRQVLEVHKEMKRDRKSKIKERKAKVQAMKENTKKEEANKTP